MLWKQPCGDLTAFLHSDLYQNAHTQCLLGWEFRQAVALQTKTRSSFTSCHWSYQQVWLLSGDWSHTAHGLGLMAFSSILKIVHQLPQQRRVQSPAFFLLDHKAVVCIKVRGGGGTLVLCWMTNVSVRLSVDLMSQAVIMLASLKTLLLI